MLKANGYRDTVCMCMYERERVCVSACTTTTEARMSLLCYEYIGNILYWDLSEVSKISRESEIFTGPLRYTAEEGQKHKGKKGAKIGMTGMVN